MARPHSTTTPSSFHQHNSRKAILRSAECAQSCLAPYCKVVSRFKTFSGIYDLTRPDESCRVGYRGATSAKSNHIGSIWKWICSQLCSRSAGRSSPAQVMLETPMERIRLEEVRHLHRSAIQKVLRTERRWFCRTTYGSCGSGGGGSRASCTARRFCMDCTTSVRILAHER